MNSGNFNIYQYYIFIVRVFKIVFTTIIIILVLSNTLLAADNIFFNIQESFFQNESIESEKEIVAYLLNFHEIDRQMAESLSIGAYFSEQIDSESNWYYSRDEELLELTGIFSNSSFTINTYQELLSGESDYLSWLLGYRNHKVELRLEEKYIGLDQIKEAESDLLLEISIVPRDISYESREILSEIEFHYGSNKGENRLNTTVWLNNNSLKDIGVVARKINTNNEEQIRYYILQMAAAVVSRDSFSEINEGLLTIGDLNGINELFDHGDIDNRYINNFLGIELANNMLGVEFKQESERYEYLLELAKLYEQQELVYSASGRFFIVSPEKLALSFIFSNELEKGQEHFENRENHYLPVFRLGVYDEISWTDDFTIAVSYYPFQISKRDCSNHLWQLSTLYQKKSWELRYSGEFLTARISQEVSLAYLLNDERSISINYGLDYDDNTRISLVYSFNI